MLDCDVVLVLAADDFAFPPLDPHAAVNTAAAISATAHFEILM
jgi:hypothetical protein